MTEKDPMPEYRWVVTLREGIRSVHAAYIQEGAGSTIVTGHATSVVLKDDQHKTVFYAPPGEVTCIERIPRAREGDSPARWVPLPESMNITPGQIRDLQDALNRVGGCPVCQRHFIVLPPGSKVAEPQGCEKP